MQTSSFKIGDVTQYNFRNDVYIGIYINVDRWSILDVMCNNAIVSEITHQPITKSHQVICNIKIKESVLRKLNTHESNDYLTKQLSKRVHNIIKAEYQDLLI